MNSRPIALADHAQVLRLNAESVHFLSPLTPQRLQMLLRESEFHRVADDDTGYVRAFLLSMREGADYDSINYRWFAQRYARFLYIDRVVVSAHGQSAGIGSGLYRELFQHAAQHGVQWVACEFDVEPPNPVSQRFHAKFGFSEVGRQAVADGHKVVSLQMAPVGPKDVQPASAPG